VLFSSNKISGPFFFDIPIGWISILMQMMWRLVNSSWILHVNCNKRRVASIAALLSSVLHRSVFTDEGMHLINNRPGPLKWVCVSFMCMCITTIYTFHSLTMVAMLSIDYFCSLLKMLLRKVQKVLVQFALQHYI